MSCVEIRACSRPTWDNGRGPVPGYFDGPRSLAPLAPPVIMDQYKDSYRLCYVRGPEGIIVALAEQIS